MAMGMPTGVSSNIPIGFRPALVISPLTTRFVEVLINVTELARIAANATGINNRDDETPALVATPMITGTKKAAAAVLLTNELSVATASMVAKSNRFTPFPPGAK